MCKKEGTKDFDVTIGSFDGAKVCNLVGLYVLHVSSNKYEKNLNGIYRGDGLACFENVSGPQADQIRKDFISLFRKEFQLSIVCETDLKIANFPDVTLANISLIRSQTIYQYISTESRITHLIL